jgi:hypothetical protein
MFIYFYAFCVFISEADLSEAGPSDNLSGPKRSWAFATLWSATSGGLMPGLRPFGRAFG